VSFTLSRGEHGWRLVIEDNGRGFPFGGRLTLDQLEASDRGPVVIRECVRAIRGALTVESEPGRGARIEVEWPGAPAGSRPRGPAAGGDEG
jgi:signal transduction histidine kinase